MHYTNAYKPTDIKIIFVDLVKALTNKIHVPALVHQVSNYPL